MGIKSYFKDLSDKRAEKRKADAIVSAAAAEERAQKRRAVQQYSDVTAAIQLGNLSRVQELVKQGVDAGYKPPDAYRDKYVLSLALAKGDVAIFKALLDTPSGREMAANGGTELRTLRHSYQEGTVYFVPNFLYAAIEQGKEEIALALLQVAGVSPEFSGELMGSRHIGSYEQYRSQVKSPLQLAQEKGLTRAAEAIAQKIAPIAAARVQAEAKALAEKAVEMKAAAEQMLKQANDLAPQKSVAAPRNKFNV